MGPGLRHASPPWLGPLRTRIQRNEVTGKMNGHPVVRSCLLKMKFVGIKNNFKIKNLIDVIGERPITKKSLVEVPEYFQKMIRAHGFLNYHLI